MSNVCNTKLDRCVMCIILIFCVCSEKESSVHTLHFVMDPVCCLHDYHPTKRGLQEHRGHHLSQGMDKNVIIIVTADDTLYNSLNSFYTDIILT